MVGSRTLSSAARPAGVAAVDEPRYAVAAIHRGIGPGETLWHVRAALNVASLSCWGKLQTAIAANYNFMLKQHRQPLARAYAAEQTAYRARYGNDWRRQNDTHQTRLYDFFTKPMAQVAFCDIALDISERIRTLAPSELEKFAPGALARLEQPFVSTESASR